MPEARHSGVERMHRHAPLAQTQEAGERPSARHRQMARPTFNQFREKALTKPGVKAEYDALPPVVRMKTADDRASPCCGPDSRTDGSQAGHQKEQLFCALNSPTGPPRIESLIFRVEPVKMGALLPGRSYDSIGALLEEAEGHQ